MYNHMMYSIIRNKSILDEISSSETVKIETIVELHKNYGTMYSKLADMERFRFHNNYKIRNKRPIIQIVSDFYRFTGGLVQNDVSFDIFHIQLQDNIYTLTSEDVKTFIMMKEVTNKLVDTIKSNMPKKYQQSSTNHTVRSLDFKDWLQCYNNSNKQIEEFIIDKYNLYTSSMGTIGYDLINKTKNKF